MVLKVVSASNAANANNNGNANNNTASNANYVAAIIPLRLEKANRYTSVTDNACKEDKENHTFCLSAVNKQGDAA